MLDWGACQLMFQIVASLADEIDALGHESGRTASSFRHKFLARPNQSGVSTPIADRRYVRRRGEA